MNAEVYVFYLNSPTVSVVVAILCRHNVTIRYCFSIFLLMGLSFLGMHTGASNEPTAQIIIIRTRAFFNNKAMISAKILIRTRAFLENATSIFHIVSLLGNHQVYNNTKNSSKALHIQHFTNG